MDDRGTVVEEIVVIDPPHAADPAPSECPVHHDHDIDVEHPVEDGGHVGRVRVVVAVDADETTVGGLVADRSSRCHSASLR